MYPLYPPVPPPMVTVAVSVAFCEIFSVKEWRDLKNRFAVDIGKRYGEIEHRCSTVLQRWRGSGGNVRPSHLLVRFLLLLRPFCYASVVNDNNY